ncbi:MAG TPA: RNA methyltransferase [Candidatus Dojkabacteria bacterium]|nr:RNA methyltransferase [Candidatus Dojkabacteria bacterium]
MNNNKEIRLHIVLDNIRSVFNVGSIFRTADATGCAKIYICGMTPTPENPKMYKTALGAIETVPWEYYKTTLDAINELKERHIPIVSVELTDDAYHFQSYDYPHEVALVFGHERLGVNNLVLAQSDAKIMIPMLGIKESLNVANTASIIMFEALREEK